MTRKEALDYIEEQGGKIFSIRFKKRSDGTIREMVCRQGVKTGLAFAPSKPPTDWSANALIPVYDMQAKGYRSIPIEGILALKVEGKWEDVGLQPPQGEWKIVEVCLKRLKKIERENENFATSAEWIDAKSAYDKACEDYQKIV